MKPTESGPAAGDRSTGGGRGIPDPIFLVAPARSYSTVCLAILAGHPHIYGFPEMLLFSADTVGDLLIEQQRRPDLPADWSRRRVSGVLRAIADLREQSQEDAAISGALAWLSERPQWTTVQLMDHLLELASPLIGLEKSPDTAHSRQALSRCLASYPTARFIHLTRHPVTTMHSMQRNMRPRWRGGEAELVVSSVSAWHIGHFAIARQLADLPPDRWIRVRAEDLLAATDETLGRILDWLSMSCDAGILRLMRRTELWRFAGTGPSGGLYGGDAGFMRAPELRTIADPGPVVFDSSWGLSRETDAALTRLANYLGY